MSNFICSECGMTNIDCGGAGYKTPKEIELEQQIERLQEQLAEANDVIDACCSLPETNWVVIDSYKEKWGVK